MPQYRALFVCLGNICRSPIAEACFKQILEEKGIAQDWWVDSAATSPHESGREPDFRGRMCMMSHGVFHHVERHRARPITSRDYHEFDFIFCMDEDNMSDLLDMAPKGGFRAKIHMLGAFDDDQSFNGVIQDPYYATGGEEFEIVYGQCWRSCKNFLKSLPPGSFGNGCRCERPG